jgi:DNA-binding transcriptional LysR family regulator
MPFKRFILFSLHGMRFGYTLTGMELRHIRYFVAAAEDLNISRAAKRLNVSQPAMSRLIKDLESELGVLLFERERFGLRLTLSGEQMLYYAKQILALCQEAKETISIAPTPAKTIKIGFLSPALDLFLAEGLREIHERDPGILVKTHELPPGAQILALRDKKIDVALLGNFNSAQLLDFEHKILFELTLKVALPSRHPLAERNTIELKQLATDDFIGYDEQSFPGRNQTIIKACKVAGFEPKLRYKVNSLMEVLAMISSGMGVCLMPEDVASLPHSNVLSQHMSNWSLSGLQLLGDVTMRAHRSKN